MRKFPLLFLALFFLSWRSFAQETWSLERCVDYAKSHNIQIKQSMIQARLSRLLLKQSQLSRLPNLSGSTDAGYNFGRSIDPTSNQFVDNQLFFAGASLNLNLTVFDWFQKAHNIRANRFALMANSELVNKLENDISLNVATAYLAILLNTETYQVDQQQVQLSLSELQNTRRQVEAGALPESNQADLESQVASDSSTLITARNNLALSVLQMKALLNLDFDTPFSVDTLKNIDAIPLMNLNEEDPEDIYEKSLAIQPQILADSLNQLSLRNTLASSRAALYPALFLSGSMGTNYASTYRLPYGAPVDISQPLGTVNVNGTDYTVNSFPFKSYNYRRSPFRDQLGNNFNQSLVVGLNIPLFNGYSSRSNVRRAQMNLENQQLTIDQDKLTLRQTIYQAFADAKGSLEQYRASIKALSAAQTAYDYAARRYALGLITSVDFLTTENNLFKAQTNMLTGKYNYIFKVKVLEFYKTLNVKL